MTSDDRAQGWGAWAMGGLATGARVARRRRVGKCVLTQVRRAVASCLGLAVILGFGSICGADNGSSPEGGGGPWERLVELPADAVGGEGDVDTMVAVPLDSDLHAATLDRWVDLRMFDSADREVPYWLRVETVDERVPRRRSFPVQQLTVNPAPDEGLEIEFQIDGERHTGPLHGLRLVTGLRDFERQVSAWRRDEESGDWEPLAEDTLLYDYSRYLNVRSLDIEFGERSLPTAAGRYRIRIDRPEIGREGTVWRELTRELGDEDRGSVKERIQVNQTPFRIDRIESLRDDQELNKSQPVLVDFPLEIIEVRQSAEDKTTWVDVRSRREPLTELVLVSDDRNFSREVRLNVPERRSDGGDARSEVQAKGIRWRELARGQWTKIDVAGVRRETLALKAPEARAAVYRIAIVDGDSPPLESLKFVGRGPRRQVIFLAKADETYRLGYGEAERKLPRYDTAAIRAALDSGAVPVRATLGTAVAGRTIVSPSAWTWLQNPWLFGVIVLSLLVLLGGTLKQAAARLDDGDRDGEAGGTGTVS